MARLTSIRRSLMSNLVMVILLLSCGILATTIFAARRAVRSLSESLTTRTVEQVDARLHGFFDPVAEGLRIVASWGEAGIIDLDQPEQLLPLLTPIIRQLPQVSSLMIADSGGRELMILQTSTGWVARQTRADQWGPRTLWANWGDGAGSTLEWSWKTVDYDPRLRPWYRGAVEAQNRQNEVGALHWTEPYEFFTTKEPGITASLTYRGRGDGDCVVGFDVLLKDISLMTTQIQIGEHGVAVVLSSDDRMIGLPRDPRYMDEKNRVPALLKRPEELGIQLAVDADRVYQQLDHPTDIPLRFYSSGEAWWTLARQFRLSPGRYLINCVVVPEADMLGGVTRIRAWILLVTLVVLGVALLRAFVLAHRYSEPIEALVRQSEQISHLKLDRHVTVRSRVKEVMQLAAAHERMRVALQSMLRLERDLRVARQIQQSTLPDRLPRLQGFDIQAWSEPADETGGDTYDIVGVRSGVSGQPLLVTETHAERAVILLADATGHGVGPALSVTQVRAMLRMAVRMHAGLHTMAAQINEQLCDDLPTDRFITVWMGEINAAERTIRGFSAGQGPILHYRAKQDRFTILPADAPPLGITSNMDIVIPEPVRLGTGDLYLLISDGVYEAADDQGLMIGTQGVIDMLYDHRRANSQQIIDAVRDLVRQHVGSRPAADDQTVIVVKCIS